MNKNRAAAGSRRTGGLVLGLAAALAVGPAVAADVTTPIYSGLAFRSGATGASPCLAALRGRKLDANHVFLTHKSFPLLVRNTGGLAGAAKAAPLLLACSAARPRDVAPRSEQRAAPLARLVLAYVPSGDGGMSRSQGGRTAIVLRPPRASA